jgi:hypothetical protein
MPAPQRNSGRTMQDPPTGAYLAWLERSRWTVDRVAAAWRKGDTYGTKNSALSTDGQSVYSYWHRIGETAPAGTKIAYSCGYSVTTRRHSNAIARVADVTVPCGEH